jgi:hypothetical protein
MTRKTSLLLVVALAACGRGESGRGEDQGAAKPAAGEPATAAKPAPAKAAPAALTPYNVDPAKVLNADELHRAYFAWKWDKKAVSVVGYCKLFSDTGPLADCRQLVAEPNGDKGLVDIKAKEGSPVDPLDRVTPVVLRCTIGDLSWSEPRLEDCSLVAKGQPASVDDRPTPGTDHPIPVATLVSAINGWAGKEVQVVGYYWGHTTSKGPSGEILSRRVDLTPPGGGGDAVVACEVAAEPPQSISGQRDGVTVRGTIAPDTFFEQVLLKPCVITNR